MDGKMLLAVCVAILAGAYFLSRDELSLGFGGGSNGALATSRMVVDLRHNEIQQTLRREGYDLDDPASYVRERDGVLVVGGPVAATEHARPVFIDRIVEGYHRPVLSETPGKVTAAEIPEACRFTAPAAGSRVVNVFANATLHPVSFYAFEASELDTLAMERLLADGGAGSGLISIADKIRQKRAENGAPQLSAPFRYSVMELAVTETEQPVHLVLQTGAGRVLWNLHHAKGVEISGVSLLGGHLPVIANLPRRVPVEVMDATQMAACGVVPVRLPRATDPVFRDIDSGALPLERARAGLEEMKADSEVWNAWFEEQFGLRSDQSRIGYDEAAIMALVGPMPEGPEARVAYKSLSGAPVVMPEAQEAFGKKPKLAETRVGRLAKERAEVLAANGLAPAAEVTE